MTFDLTTRQSSEPISRVYLSDCMEFMKQVTDKFFELAIVDPPYGIGEDGEKNHSRRKLAKPTKYTPKKWDKYAPEKTYFDELIRISKNQIIWGANHFISKIPYDSSCWIVWDKENGDNDFADCELAWTSFNTAVRIYKYKWAGMLQGNMKNKEIRIHPTQKPVQLYKWLLKNYAKPNDKIFDSHLGSQSSRIAAYQMGFDFWGTELDAEYFEAGCKRFNLVTSQTTLFDFIGTGIAER
jgi:site-specific DNA-methyltransferase (adenine-specific)